VLKDELRDDGLRTGERPCLYVLLVQNKNLIEMATHSNENIPLDRKGTADRTNKKPNNPKPGSDDYLLAVRF